MVDVFVDRTFSPPLTPADVFALAREAGGCFHTHRVEWVESLLSLEGIRMLCHFRTPDLESLRLAFRQAGADVPRLLPGTMHQAPAPLAQSALALSPVVVVREFPEAVTLAAIQAIEDEGAWCLEIRNVHFERTFLTGDRRTMICLYRAPDAEAVRQAQQQARVPFTSVWAFRHLTPADLPG